ncbi:hypothetical protein ACLKA7_006685 [Drosophila subpalustris]
MICKEGNSIIDMIDVKHQDQGTTGMGNNNNNMTTSLPANGYTTLQHRRKSQLITFSASSCDIKNSLSHELIANGGYASAANATGGGSSTRASRANVRLSFAEEDVMILPQQQQQSEIVEDEVFRRRSLLEVELGVEVGEELELQLEEDEEEEEIEEEEEMIEEDVELYMHDEFETHIDAKSNNANDDSGGGSYEDSHALHSSLGGSNRNSLEKDDDDIEVDVISTDVSCYDQLLGSSCNTRDDDIATLIGDGDNNYHQHQHQHNQHHHHNHQNQHQTKLGKTTTVVNSTLAPTSSALIHGAGNNSHNGVGVLNGVNGVVPAAADPAGNGSGSGSNGSGSGGIIYANPFMDDEGIAESGM